MPSKLHSVGIDPSISSPVLTILRTVDGRPIGKRFERQSDGWHRTKPAHRDYLVETVQIPSTLYALSTVLQNVSRDPTACLLRDTTTEPCTLTAHPMRRRAESFQNRRSPFVPLDLDGVPVDELEGVDLRGWSPGKDTALDVDVLNAIRRQYLPAQLQRAPAIAVWSASTCWKKTAPKTYRPDHHPKTISVHLWFIADRPVDAEDLRSWCRLHSENGGPIDPALYHRVQPIYCGPPELAGELPRDPPALFTDPASRMVLLPADGCPQGWWDDYRDTVSADLFTPPSPARRSPPRRENRPALPSPSSTVTTTDEHLEKRFKGVARAAMIATFTAIQGSEDGPARHQSVYAGAHRLAGFAAVGLLDWNHVRAELEAVGQTSGTEKALRHAEDHPDDVTPYLRKIADDHRQKQSRKRPVLNRALTIAGGIQRLRALIIQALKGTDIAVLRLPPGLGKTTELVRLLGGFSKRQLFVFAAPNRTGAIEAKMLLDWQGARSEIWVGRDGPKLYPHQTWEQPGLHEGDEQTLQTCASEANLGRLQAGYRALCGRCPFREQCSEGEHSIRSGYLGAQRLTRKLIGEGSGVIVTTQDMLGAVLGLIKKAGADLAAIVIDEEPRVKDIEIGGLRGLSSLTGHAPDLGREIGQFLQNVASNAATEDRKTLETANPAQSAILTAHGRSVSSRYQEELGALAEIAHDALPGLAEAERRGELSRPLLSGIRALAERPGSLTVHTRLGHPATLQTLADRPELPPGVPVIIADATADQRRIRAWSGGRTVEVHTIRLQAHRGLRTLLIDNGGFQRSKLGQDRAEEVGRRIDRLVDEMEAHLSKLGQERTKRGLPLTGLLVAPRSLFQLHRGPVERLQARLTARGWTIAETHWQSVESRGSNRHIGIGVIITLGSPLQNLGSWMVQERALSYWLADPLPSDNTTNDPDSRERQRWKRSASAESWQAHNRARAWTDPDGNPFLHIAVCPSWAVPNELASLPDQQRDHLTLTGRPSTVGTWIDRTIADHGLCAVHPGLLSRLPGAPSLKSIRGYFKQGGPWETSRVWSCAFTGGGSTGRMNNCYAIDGSSHSQVAGSLEKLADLTGLPDLTLKTLQRDYLKSFRTSRRPKRKQPPRTSWSPDAALRVDVSTDHNPPPSNQPPPVKANHSNVDESESMNVRLEDQSPGTVNQNPPTTDGLPTVPIGQPIPHGAWSKAG